MKIATWNIERLKHANLLHEIESVCNQMQADILVLTETDERIHLNYKYCIHTPTPPDIMLPQYSRPLHYSSTEHRVSIYSNYIPIRHHHTWDEFTSLCVEFDTAQGPLLVYGTIIGILGNRDSSFMVSATQQAEDFNRLSADGDLCVCGDFNCSFADSYYFTNKGRAVLNQSFTDCHLNLVTSQQAMCIDHIAISERFVAGMTLEIEEWNIEKRLSDHKGIAVQLLR